MGLYRKLKTKYGQKTAEHIRVYSRNCDRLAVLIQDRRFLLQCREYGLTPKFIQNLTTKTEKLFNHANFKCRITKITQNFHNKILNNVIKEKCEYIEHIKRLINKLKNDVLGDIPENIAQEYFSRQDQRFKFKSDQSKKRQIKKFETLKQAALKELNIHTNENWFHNYTSIQVPSDVKLILALGKNFALPIDNKKFPIIQFLVDGENIIENFVDKNKAQNVRNKFCSILYNIKQHRYRNTNAEKFLLKLFDNTIHFLKRYKDVVILNADKGNATVMMDKHEYKNKMKLLLADSDVYTVTKDHTNRLQQMNNTLVAELMNSGAISAYEKNKLTLYNALPAKIYGQPKIHKAERPLRPIVSTIGSPTYNLSKLLVPILKNLTKNSKFNVHNAFEFKSRIQKIKISDDDMMVSFDVVSLFTSIPVDFVLELLHEKWRILRKYTDIDRTLFFRILQFCLVDGNCFNYESRTYSMKSLPMGSCLSPVLADIVLEELLKEKLRSLPFKPKIFVKYVDDCFSIVPKEDINTMLTELNSFHDKINFTVEIENDGKLPFLDIIAIKNEKCIITNWYQKPTATGRILNYKSNHPQHQKINTAKNFIQKVFALSDERFHLENRKKIRSILKYNSFPNRMIERMMDEYKSPLKGKKDQNQEEDKGDKYVSIMYAPKITPNFQKILGPKNESKIKLAMKPYNTVGRLFSKLKDKTEKNKMSNIVYKINCIGNTEQPCNGTYIGTTKNYLKTRMDQHKRDIHKKTNTTALATHCAENNHHADLDNVKILTKENNIKKRFIMEAIHIQKTANTINKKTDTDAIKPYINFINSLRT